MRISPQKCFLNLFVMLTILTGLQTQAFADYYSNYSAIMSNQELKSQLAEIGYSPESAAAEFAKFEEKYNTTDSGGAFALCGRASLGAVVTGGGMICSTLTNAYKLISLAVGVEAGASAGIFGIYFKSSALKTTGESCYRGVNVSDVGDIGLAGGFLIEYSCRKEIASQSPSSTGFLGFIGVAGGIQIGFSVCDTTLYHYKHYKLF